MKNYVELCFMESNIIACIIFTFRELIGNVKLGFIDDLNCRKILAMVLSIFNELFDI